MEVLSNMCYLCLTNDKLMYDFTSDDEYTQILEKINFVMPELMILEVSVNICTRICSECIAQIKAFYVFKNRCLCIHKESPSSVQVLTDYTDNEDYVEDTSLHQIFGNTLLPDDDGSVSPSMNENIDDTSDNFILLAQDIDLKEEIIDGDIKSSSEDVTIGNNNEENTTKDFSSNINNTNTASILIQIENGIKYYKCSICDRRYKAKSNLKYHLNIHAGIFDYSCDKCEKKFTQKRYLQQHISCVHTRDCYQCRCCGKTYKSKSNYKSHILQHAGFQIHSCLDCGKQFLNKNNLNDHMLLHENGQFECSVCNKSFAVRRYLKAHEKIHTIIYCSYCNEKFYQKSILNQHLRRCTAKNDDVF